MERMPIIIDCDPGHDDAIALVMACHNVRFDLLGVTTTAGNQTLGKTTANARKLLDFLGVRPPLAKGAEKPMVRELQIAPSVHGDSGLDGPFLPETDYMPVAEPAWDLCRRLILGSPTPVTFVATGPLTNLGILFTCYPEVKENIERICLMGGGLDHGNWTVAAEFNILVDPEAADIVFNSGIPIIMCGLDVTEKAVIHPQEVEEIRSLGNPVAVLVAELIDFFSQFHLKMGFPGATLHDPCTIAYLLAPNLFTTEPHHVQVETQGRLTTGMTVADRRTDPDKKTPNVLVCMDLDRRGFIDLLMESCRSY